MLLLGVYTLSQCSKDMTCVLTKSTSFTDDMTLFLFFTSLLCDTAGFLQFKLSLFVIAALQVLLHNALPGGWSNHTAHILDLIKEISQITTMVVIVSWLNINLWKTSLTWMNSFIQSLYTCVLISKQVGKVLIASISLCFNKFPQCRNFSTDENCPALTNQTGEPGARTEKKPMILVATEHLTPNHPASTSRQAKWIWLGRVQSGIQLGLPLGCRQGMQTMCYIT